MVPFSHGMNYESKEGGVEGRLRFIRGRHSALKRLVRNSEWTFLCVPSPFPWKKESGVARKSRSRPPLAVVEKFQSFSLMMSCCVGSYRGVVAAVVGGVSFCTIHVVVVQ